MSISNETKAAIFAFVVIALLAILMVDLGMHAIAIRPEWQIP